MKTLLASIAFVLSVTSALADDQVISIGAIMHLTGDFAMYGASFREGVELAESEINERGGIRGRKVRVVFEDSEMKPVKAHSAAMKLLNVDNVTAGLITTMTEAKSAGTLFEQRKKPIICLWDSAPQLDDIGEYVFGIGAWLPGSGEVAADFAYNNLRARTAGIIAAVNDEASMQVSRIFSDMFKKFGGRIAIEQSIDPQGADFRTILLKNREANPDVLYAPFGYNQATFIKQVRESGFKGPVVFLDTLSEDVIRQAGEAAEGVYQTQVGDPDAEATGKFIQLYRKHFGRAPSSVLFSAWGFDGMNLLASAMQAGSDDSQAIMKWLHALRGYDGASGPIAFTSGGSSRVYPKMYRVESGKLKLVSNPKTDITNASMGVRPASGNEDL
jgi:branched-chain amino acid transport system substrate-binding protein